jgi:hypothetical protein
MKGIVKILVLVLVLTGGSTAVASYYSTNFDSHAVWTTVQGQDGWTSYGNSSKMYAKPASGGVSDRGLAFLSYGVGDSYAWRPISDVPDNSKVRVEFDVELSDCYVYGEIWCMGRDGTGGQAPQSFQIYINGSKDTGYQVATNQNGGNFYSVTGGMGMAIATTAHIAIDADYGTHTYTVNVQNGVNTWIKSGLSWTDTTGNNGSTDALRGLYYSGVGDQSIVVDNINVVPEPATAAILALGGMVFRLRGKRRVK